MTPLLGFSAFGTGEFLVLGLLGVDAVVAIVIIVTRKPPAPPSS